MAQADPAPLAALAGANQDPTSTLRRRKQHANNAPLGLAQAAPELDKGHTEKEDAPLGKTPDGTGPSSVPYLVPESGRFLDVGLCKPRLTHSRRPLSTPCSVQDSADAQYAHQLVRPPHSEIRKASCSLPPTPLSLSGSDLRRLVPFA